MEGKSIETRFTEDIMAILNKKESNKTEKDREKIKKMMEISEGMTKEDYRLQAIGFVAGNVGIDNPDITRDAIEKAYQDLEDSGYKFNWEHNQKSGYGK